MLRRRRTVEHGPSLALPPPEEDAARASAEEAGKVKEREGVEKDEKGLMTPTRSTTGPPGSATGPTTEMEVFRSGGSKPSAKGSTEHPNGRPMTLAPLVPLQQQMAPLFTKEQLKESRAAARLAPQVFGKAPPPSSSEEQGELLQRPAFLQEEEEKFGGKKRAPGGYEEDESEELRRCEDEDSEEDQGRRRSRLQEEKEEEIMWRWQISRDMKKLTSLCQDQQRENDRLQQELYEWRLEDAERKRQEEDKKKKKKKEEGHVPRSSSTFNTPEEAKPEAPSVLDMLGSRGRTPWSTYPARYGKGSRSQSKDPPRKGRSPSYGKGFKEDPKSTAQRPTMGGAKPSPEIQQMEVMALLVESMKALPRQISEGHESQGTIKGVEVVRQVAELPALGSIQGSTSQLQLGDWLLLVQPVVADLTATSDLWWEKMMVEVERWYQDHQAMPPLDRVQHEPVAPASLNVPKWAKLERRMATLLLKAIPEGQRDELVATKRLSVFAILAHLHLSYCPGGVSEKQMLLRNLEEPNEPSNLHETVVSLRRWLRWRARAQEIGVTAKSLKKDEYEEMEEERKRDLERLSNVVLEESVIMLKDEVKVMDVVYEELKKVKSAMPKEEESVLRTRIVSPKELLSEAPKWDEAIKKELHQLFEEKQALKRISEDEVEHLRKKWGRHLEILPSKVVITLKPGPRRKIRLVACGNFVDQSTPDQKDQCLYASGADAVCLRYVLKQAAEKSWGATVLDIRTAFLNAPLDVEDDGQDPTVVVLKPPLLLIKTGHVGVKEFYLAQKAMYGLRQSPRCWGLHRDSVLRKMKSKEGHRFVQADAEPNLWSIMKGQGIDDDRDEWLVGFLLVYVDDLMVASDPTTTSLIIKMLQDEWETSEPEVVGQKKVKFLGVELTQAPQGGFRASQEDYILDKEGIPEGRSVKAPMTKDALPYPEEPTAEKITEAQKRSRDSRRSSCERSTRQHKFRALSRKLNHRRLARKRSQQTKCKVKRKKKRKRSRKG